AEPRDFGFVMAREIDTSLEEDLALVRAGLAGDDIHHRRLAGAVRADDGAHLARLDRQGQRVKRPEPVEGDSDVVQIEKGRCERGHFATPPERPGSALPMARWPRGPE